MREKRPHAQFGNHAQPIIRSPVLTSRSMFVAAIFLGVTDHPLGGFISTVTFPLGCCVGSRFALISGAGGVRLG